MICLLPLTGTRGHEVQRQLGWRGDGGPRTVGQRAEGRREAASMTQGTDCDLDVCYHVFPVLTFGRAKAILLMSAVPM